MDIVEQLRKYQCPENTGCNPVVEYCQCALMDSSADEIERLREVLECLVKYWDEWKSAPDDHLTELSIAALSLEEVVNIARSALKEKK